MNRFRTKKKAKEAPEPQVRASTDSEEPPTIKASKTFRLGKKQQLPEPKLELDLANALPPSDDFRTSLLMSGLSARFSMLREQDDPTSKIGKASDDSVLFAPSKRQSRMNDFGFQPHGLTDIAEVSSIKGSSRPWAVNRADSYKTVESNGTDEESLHSGGIMNRAKPGEGNNLFGGRQKIYKIPLGASGSTKSLADGGGSGMGGRAIYESDISMSAFQKLRQRDKEQQQEEREESDHSAESASPAYNRNRETSSTTSSAGPSAARISTAATSITSQRAPSGPNTPISPGGSIGGNPVAERPANKGRRLYETGLDQHLHEQQFSAMNRIDTLTRQRALGAQTPPLGYSSPTTFAHPTERWNGTQVTTKASMPNMRAASPSPTVTPIGGFDFGARVAVPESKPQFGNPPLSPPASENDEQAVLAIEPNDRGKATALLAFSKPAQPYDDNKYSQRQLQMQQGRETPPLRKTSPAFPPMRPGWSRPDSNATLSSARSRSSSSAQRNFLPAERISETPSTSKSNISVEEVVNSARTSANGDSAGYPHVEQTEPARVNHQVRDLASLYSPDQEIPLERPPESQHPANRLRALELEEPVVRPQPSTEEAPAPSVTISSVPADSPTLGPSTEMTGLSGMVRQHLRSDSATSSVYGGAPHHDYEDEPLPQNEYTLGRHPAAEDDWYDGEIKSSLDLSPNDNKTGDALEPASVRSSNAEGNDAKSWEKELVTRHTRDGSSETQKEREDFHNDLAARRRKVQENLKSFVETESRSSSPLPGSDLLRDVGIKANPLGLLKSKTSRGSLVGRPKEYRALKALGNGAAFSRSSSPGRGSIIDDPWKEEDEEMPHAAPRGPMMPPNKAFRQARRDAQRDRERQVAQRHQQPAGPDFGGRGFASRSVEDFHRQREPSRERILPSFRSRHQTPSRERGPPPVAFTQRNGNRESQGSVDTNTASRPASRASRDRSTSDASRPMSRNGRHREDVVGSIAEGAPSPNMYGGFELSSPRSNPQSPYVTAIAPHPSSIPSPMNGSDSSRSRSDSRPTPGGYFDSRRAHQNQPGETDSAPSRPSLVTSFPSYAPPALPQASPLPQPSPLSQASPLPQASPLTQASPMTQASPAASSAVMSASTPTSQGFQSQGSVPANRKRSINKYDISEPRFVSTTSRMTTVNLPPGASLQNGIEVPPIPPVNPRRKTRAVFGFGRKEGLSDYPLSPTTPSDDRTFSDDGEPKPKPRQKLRKISSEGGNMNARARAAIFAAQSPIMPDLTPISDRPAARTEGGMF